MAQSDVREIDEDGKAHQKRRFDIRDFNHIAEQVCDDYSARKGRRADREKCWKDIDRQVAMEPETGFKYIIKNGSRVLDTNKAWMSEIELPLQAQALEVLTADARRMMFPSGDAPWFAAHAELTDEYLAKVDFQSLIKGDEAEVPSQINQDNADKLVEGYLRHLYDQPIGDTAEEFSTRQDKINAESFKYGVGVGRARMWSRYLYVKEKGGVRREVRRIPALMPVSIKNLYLDDRKATMHSSQLLEAAPIAVDHIRLANLHAAANLGSTDPDDDDGGWMPKNLKGIEPDKDGYVTLLEMEGDIVVPRKTTRSVILPGCIVTVVMGSQGKGGGTTSGVVRFRWRKTPFSSYLLHPYHYEGADDIYPSSPLMKGRPVQIAATDAMNRLLDSAMLKVQPPVGWDRSDQYLAQNGGPGVYPGALWGTVDPSAIKAFTELGGEPGTMAAAVLRLIQLYAELTGVLPARLGAQTTSHTTAFAKDAELTRGAVRTVDYVNQTGAGPTTRWLDMSYQMARAAIGRNETVSFYIPAYGGYVELTRDQLPEHATFTWFGAGGPAEESQKMQRKLQALGLALQIDQMAVQLGRKPRLDHAKTVDQVLREGGWTDIDAIAAREAPAGASVLPGPGADQGPAMAALQQLPQMIEQ